jgi:enoyl-CoA hydratase/carnithine racemase
MAIRYHSEGLVARITIDRPDAHNAFHDDMVTALAEAWERFEAGPERVAVIDGGTSRHFTVGADLKAMPRDVWKGVPGIGVRVSKPVIAAVHGCCVGVGLALVQAVDLCIAADDTQLIYAEPRVGLAYGLISGLAARIPHKFAMEVMLRGEPVDAHRAERIGMVNTVVERGHQVEEAIAWARGIADAAPKVIRWLKASVDNEVLPHGPTVHALRTMTRVQDMIDSQDFAEGKAAFVARRKPHFTGN